MDALASTMIWKNILNEFEFIDSTRDGHRTGRVKNVSTEPQLGRGWAAQDAGP